MAAANTAKRAAALLGLTSAVLAAAAVEWHLRTSVAWRALLASEPASARFVRLVIPLAASNLMLWAVGIVTFLQVHGLLRSRPKNGNLPPFPFDPEQTQLIIGERHQQDGSRSATPQWLVIPERGMTTGILITGSTGSAKTSAAQYPFLAQLVRLHAQDPARKLGGLIIDAKGNYADFVRTQCEMAGRGEDYYEISMSSGVRCNVISRPDLEAAALAGHIADMIVNVQGESFADPFWHTEAKDLATQCIRLVRMRDGREPTMVDLYRLATSYETFRAQFSELEREVVAGQRQLDERQRAELESLRFWLNGKAASLDPKLRASIAAGINGVAALFDIPSIAQAFCARPDEESFLGFKRCIEEGRIVALRVPYSQLKQVCQVVGTLMKLNFFDAVLQRLAELGDAQLTHSRRVFFMADEYDEIVTQPGDGRFFAKCREAGCASVIATQSYESVVAKIKNEHVAAQLLANLRTKIWLCSEDTYTAGQASKLCGEVEAERVSRSVQQSAKESAFSFFDGRVVSDRGSVGESTSVSRHREALFPSRVFTMLPLNVAVVKAFDGERVLEPWYVFLKPIYRDPNESWFDGAQAGRTSKC